VIGMAGRFPGAPDLDAFWDNLRQGVESISRFSAEELRAAGVDPAVLDDPAYVPAGGVLEGADLFDAGLFQMTPREAELLDPQHRVFLESVWAALEDAGYDPARYPDAIGVYGGASLNHYMLYNLLPRGDFPGPGGQALLASDKDFLTTRVSYKLNLRGPSLDVQTACSTSLVAVVLACQALLNYQCDLALAGGVSVREPQKSGYRYGEGGILSPDGHCRPFDAAARGTVSSNGVGVVVLKRLEDALADGDTVRAVIRGAAINNDGSAKVGYTAPSVPGQAEVVGMALAIAGVEPRDISYIEAHGTATPIGDPIELRALDKVFRGTDLEGTDRAYCALGALKSNLGHMDAAAGVAGLIKTVLALEHRQIPPTLHFERPNPEIGLEDGPFFVNTELREWETDRLPRRAGVSSFGVGGTNAHVVLEEAPEPPRTEPEEKAELLVLSARTPAALGNAARRLAAHLEAHPDLRLGDVAHTLRVGRRQLDARRILVARDREHAVALLTGEGTGVTAEAMKPAGEREVAFLFPGQGAQHARMAAELYEAEPVFRDEVDAACAILEGHLGFDLRRWIVPAPEDEAEAAERLAETAVTQPALFVVEYALAKLWMSWGVRPAALLGHSLGEYVAACLAGVMSLEDALGLVALRGRLAQSLAPGAMLSVSLSEEELAPLLPAGVEIAALNAPARSVASGPPEAIERLRQDLEARGVEARPLDVQRSFHSTSVDPILEDWAEAVRRVPLAAPGIPYLSNLTGTWVTAAQAADPEAWALHLRRPVRFSAAVAELLSDPRRVLLEVGPGQTLAALARRQAVSPEARPTVVSSLPHRDDPGSSHEHLLGALGRLWLAGVEVEWEALSAEGSRRVPLPAYPFERHRYWLEAPPVGGAAEAPAPGSGIQAPLWRQALPAAPEADGGALWVLLMEGSGLGPRLIQRLQEEKRETAAVVPGRGWSRLSGSAYTLDPASPTDYDALAEALTESPQPLRLVHLWSLTSEPAEAAAGVARLAAALARATADRKIPVRLDVITQGAAEPSGPPLAKPERSVLLALCQSLPMPCRGIDVVLPAAGSAEERQLAVQIAAELASPMPEGGVVALRGRRRWIEAWEELPSIPAKARKAGRWLLAGDLDEPAVELAEELAAAPGSRVALVGPAAPPRLPAVGGRRAVDLGIDPAWIARVERELAERLPPEGAAQVAAATDPLCASYIVWFLRQGGLDVAPGRAVPLSEVRARLALIPKYERFLRMLLQIVAEDGILTVEGEGDGEAIRFLKSAEEVGSPEAWRRDLEVRFPQLRGMFDLLDHCVRHYPRALAGEIEGLSVLYPEGSPELLQRASVQEERGTAGPAEPAGDLPSLLLREVLAAAAGRRPGETLRILEVGAGQGLLTRHVLSALEGRKVEYHFTDLGRAFVLRAEREASWASPAGRKLLRFGVLDISRDPEAQGYPRGSFHAVLGANVVHATPRIEETLGNLRELLAPGGILGLVEIVRQQRWAHMVWGLTDGWWHFDDLGLRTTSPLLDPETWKAAMTRSGFEAAEAYSGHPAGEGDGPRADLSLLLARRPAGDAAAVGGDDAVFLQADPADPASLATALAEARRRLGKLDGAVYLAPSCPWDEETFPAGLRSARSFAETLGGDGKPGFVALAAPDLAARPYLAAIGEPAGAVTLAWNEADPPGANVLAAALDRLAGDPGLSQAVLSSRRPAALSDAAVETATADAATLVGIPEDLAGGDADTAIHDRPNLVNPYVAPRDETEQAVVDIWRKALGIERIGVNDNFMELGGDSLIGLQVVHAVLAQWDLGGRKLSLYETPTVASIAQLLSGSHDDAAPFDQRSSRGERRRDLRKNLKRTSR
jgi:acyl transferase domain-containing protein